jgi:hypothetical protein
MSQVLIVVGIALVVGGLAAGLPAWRSWQGRIAAERNADRYAAWRGRADRSAPPTSTPMTSGEQRGLILAVGLGVLGAVALVIGLSGS